MKYATPPLKKRFSNDYKLNIYVKHRYICFDQKDEWLYKAGSTNTIGINRISQKKKFNKI